MIQRWGLHRRSIGGVRRVPGGRYVLYADYAAHVRLLREALMDARRLEAASAGWRAASEAKSFDEVDRYADQISLINGRICDVLVATALPKQEDD